MMKNWEGLFQEYMLYFLGQEGQELPKTAESHSRHHLMQSLLNEMTEVEVNDIAYRYAGREGFIYYREAYDFINEMENFLYQKGYG